MLIFKIYPISFVTPSGRSLPLVRYNCLERFAFLTIDLIPRFGHGLLQMLNRKWFREKFHDT